MAEPVSAVSAAASLSTTLPPEPVVAKGLRQNETVSSAKAPASQHPVLPAAQAGNEPQLALPTAPAVDPQQQAEQLRAEPRHVVNREVEKAKAGRRDVLGAEPGGTLVEGIEDDRLFAMLRRFDIQITHVLHPAANLPPREPDLRPSTLPGLASHSDILKSNLERVYATMGIAGIRGSREAGRLMSWSTEERHRTGSFCVAYFTAWIFGYAIAAVCAFFAVLVLVPESRNFFFPPVLPPTATPPSITDPTNTKGDESLVGNVDSQVVHRSKAEQAEEQAWEFTSLVQAFSVKAIMGGREKAKKGKAGNADVGEKAFESSSSSSAVDSEDEGAVVIRDGERHASQGLSGADLVINGEKVSATEPISDKKKRKMAAAEAKKQRDAMVTQYTKAAEDSLGSLADTMERFANALNSPRPYPPNWAKPKIVGAFLVPPMLVAAFVPSAYILRGASFGLGLGFFGQPLLIRGMKEFMRRVPNWQEYLDLRNSILSGVPTDAQLTLHLLRVAESLSHPLPRPPPPPLTGTPKEAIGDTSVTGMSTTEDSELQADLENADNAAEEAMIKARHGAKNKLAGGFRAAAKRLAKVGGDVSVEGSKKKIGTKVDRLLFRANIKDDMTLESYPCKYNGVSGHIVLEPISVSVARPLISFVPLSAEKQTFTLPIDDIVEIKKAHVGIARSALGWASGADVEGLGLHLRFKSAKQRVEEAIGAQLRSDGETMVFKSVGRREQLFVRLISMGQHRWEVL